MLLKTVIQFVHCSLKRLQVLVTLPTILFLSLGAATVPFSTASMAAELLNINQADVQAIAETLTGIGPAKAQAIVEYRRQNGTFTQLEDLTNVPGIGEATLAQIRAVITLGDMAANDAIATAVDTSTQEAVIEQ